METRLAFGVDVGNVIINHRPIMDTKDETLWNEKYSLVPPSDNVFDCLKRLNEEKFNGNVYLVSKCPEWQEKRALKWLKDHDFFAKTGIDSKKIYFVRERSEKDIICRKLGLTHFIDDRLEVLSHMVESTPNLFLFMPDPEEVRQFKEFIPKVTVVSSWDEVVNKIIN